MKELKNMQTISQVAKLTGISPRTLQYYDASGLLKPSGYTATGYRLYDTEALEKLQQILFFKELGFKLKEIQEFISQPDFDKIAAYKKQKDAGICRSADCGGCAFDYSDDRIKAIHDLG